MNRTLASALALALPLTLAGCGAASPTLIEPGNYRVTQKTLHVEAEGISPARLAELRSNNVGKGGTAEVCMIPQTTSLPAGEVIRTLLGGPEKCTTPTATAENGKVEAALGCNVATDGSTQTRGMSIKGTYDKQAMTLQIVGTEDMPGVPGAKFNTLTELKLERLGECAG